MALPELQPHQIQALQTLNWLYSQRDDDRRTGRSTVQALHYLYRLVRGDTDRNGWIHIDDHWDSMDADRHLLRRVLDLSSELGIQLTHGRGNRQIRLASVPVPRNSMNLLLDLVSRETSPKRIQPPAEPPRTAWERLNEDP